MLCSISKYLSDLSCTYLAHCELESILIITAIINIITACVAPQACYAADRAGVPSRAVPGEALQDLPHSALSGWDSSSSHDPVCVTVHINSSP